MYDYVDRPVASLDRGGQLLVWAMRRWVKDRAAGSCPCREIGPAFHVYRLTPALPFFQRSMTLLTGSMRQTLALGAAHVSEHEAVVLALIRTLPARNLDDAADIAGLLVRAEAAPRLADALRQLALRLFARDLLYGVSDGRPGDRRSGRDGMNDTGNA